MRFWRTPLARAALAIGALLLAGGGAAVANEPINFCMEDGGVTITLPGDVPMELACGWRGPFDMGSPEDERGRSDDEGPVTDVFLSDDYYIGKYPVTQAQWEAVMGAGNWPDPPPSTEFGLGDDHPVYNVSYDDALEFIDALAEHLEATGQLHVSPPRLPTEAEWERATRGWTETRFFFGDSLDCDDDAEDCAAGPDFPGNRSDHMWYVGNSGGSTQPVGQKGENWMGLHDTSGNVWEWTADFYADSLPGGFIVDYAGPETGTERVIRGGSWASPAVDARSAARNSLAPTSTGPEPGTLGFRVASTVPLPGAPTIEITHPAPDVWDPTENMLIRPLFEYEEGLDFTVTGTADPVGSMLDRMYWRLNGGSWVEFDAAADWSFVIPELQVGPNELEIRATNIHGLERITEPRIVTRLGRVGTYCEPGTELTIELPGEFGGTVELELVCVPAGSFVMGSPPGELARTSSSEEPRTVVVLSRDFYVGKYPVTQAQWEALMGDNPSHFSDEPDSPDRPVESVSWDDVEDFIEALNDHLGATDQHEPHARLPTDAEWEYATRAGTTTRFFFGDANGIPHLQCGSEQTIAFAYMWYCANADGTTHPVYEKLPNPWGLHDTHGHVYEWCADWFEEALPGGVVMDPTGPELPPDFENPRRVNRGSSFFGNAHLGRSASRSGAQPALAQNIRGFRLVLGLEPGSDPDPGPDPDPDPADAWIVH